jgi:hypothetical protein
MLLEDSVSTVKVKSCAVNRLLAAYLKAAHHRIVMECRHWQFWRRDVGKEKGLDLKTWLRLKWDFASGRLFLALGPIALLQGLDHIEA